MLHLTKKEQKVLAVTIFLLLTGLAVKSYRTAHPPETFAHSEPVTALEN